MEEEKRLSSNAAMVCLSVYREGHGAVWGEIHNMYYEYPIPCHDMGDFLIKLDNIYNELGHPMAYMALRSFFPHRQGRTEKTAPHAYHDERLFDPYSIKKGRGAEKGIGAGKMQSLFYIHTIFRQNATWQGKVVWLKAGDPKSCHFRSALELVHLLDEVLHAKEQSDSKCAL